MDLVFGIIIIAVSVAFGLTASPILIMAGVMGASDDPNNGWKEYTLGFAVIAAAILIPVGLFFTGFYILF